MKASHSSNLDILGASIGGYIHCAKLIASKRVEALKLLSKLDNVAIIDPQVVFNLLRVCGSFCRLAHIAWSTPPACRHPSLSHHWIKHAPHQGYCVWCQKCLIPKGDSGRGGSIFVWVPVFSMKSVMTAPGV